LLSLKIWADFDAEVRFAVIKTETSQRAWKRTFVAAAIIVIGTPEYPIFDSFTSKRRRGGGICRGAPADSSGNLDVETVDETARSAERTNESLAKSWAEEGTFELICGDQQLRC
jgi:hypothetical protein